MKNPELKRELLMNGKMDDYCRNRYNLIEAETDDNIMFYNVLMDSFDSYKEYEQECRRKAIEYLRDTLSKADTFGLTREEFNACEQMRCCKRTKTKKIEKHLKYWFDNLTGSEQVIFGTLTFNDDDLDTNIDTRRQYVRRFLNEWCDDYIANIDYGKQNEREHYHFVALIDGSLLYRHEFSYMDKNGKQKIGSELTCDQMQSWSSKHGFTKTRLVPGREKDSEQISRYISKLSNHSLKVQTEKLIVKRGSKYKEDIKRSKS